MSCVSINSMRHFLKTYLAVGLGGVIGSCLRYLISLTMVNEGLSNFPWTTLFVNLSGAFLLPFILLLPIIQSKVNKVVFLAVTTGIIGSYTTFSMITIELFMLFQESFFKSAIYLLLTFIGGLLCSLGGVKVAGLFSKEVREG